MDEHPPAFHSAVAVRSELEHRCYGRMSSAVHDSRNAYAGALYHLGQVRSIEARIHDVLGKYDFAAIVPKGSVAAIGRARLADFEYQGFILAFRRSLEYLAWGLSTYFSAQTHSIREFGKRVGNWKPMPVAKAMEASYLRHAGNFAFAVANDKGRSLRDRLAHKEFLTAFQVNVGPFGFRLCSPDAGFGRDAGSLSELLERRARDLHACIADMLLTFRTAVAEIEGPGSFQFP